MTDGYPIHHPGPDMLAAYAAGNMDEATAVLTATHLALCPLCRRDVSRLEAVGGALTEALEPVPLGSGALAAVLARLDEPEPERPAEARLAAAPEPDDETLRTVPLPLRRYLSGSLSSLPWKWRGPAIRELPLAVGGGAVRASLLRVRGGGTLPSHTHTGSESTLVLSGAFRDGPQRFGRGDLAVATSDDDHRPVADPDAECLCFAVIDGPLRLTGPIGRLFNRFVRL